MTGPPATIVVMAKAPVPGRVKTRLCPPCTPAQAARLAEAALCDTLDAVLAAPAGRRVVALDGRPGRWLPPGVEVVAQRGGSLDERIAAVLAATPGPVLVIGMDTPQLSAAGLADALAELGSPDVDAVLGPALDGGWWALGLSRAHPDDVLGVPMSTAATGAAQHRRLRSRGRRTVLLPPLRDVDTMADARAVAASWPRIRFAAAVAGLGHHGRIPAPPAVLRAATGEALALPLERWFGAPTACDLDVLDRAVPPVLDVGCGPGRHVLALAARGMVALGIDVAPHAVHVARQRGAPVLERSVFSRVPGGRRWRSALLLDGNVGIGGDPVVLLRRVAELLHPAGRLLVELEPPGAPPRREAVRLEVAGIPGQWFPWARVGVDGIGPLAADAGLAVVERWRASGRFFAHLERS